MTAPRPTSAASTRPAGRVAADRLAATFPAGRVTGPPAVAAVRLGRPTPARPPSAEVPR